jgi:tetratricopeptide (TPR) repeat protein
MPWGYGSLLNSYGYWPYDNPYYASSYATPYNYSQPIDATYSQPPSDAALDAGNSLFDSARNAYKAGDFASALGQVDAALKQIPNDTDLHEFRALCLFALGRYDEAAATLYAVLSVGPGWDWPTVIGLYQNVDVYTAHLRALEAYCKANPQSATGRFVLAYQYLTAGHLDAAEAMLKQVVALKPSDSISAKLLKALEANRQGQAVNPAGGAPGAAAPPGTQPAPGTQPVPGVPALPGGPPGAAADVMPGPEPVPMNTTVPEGATISGTWSAKPNADTAISLAIEQDGRFVWKVTQKEQTREFKGVSTFGSGVLTLAQDNGPALVGRVGWKDPKQMTFKVVGGGPEDPGLTFSK